MRRIWKVLRDELGQTSLPAVLPFAAAPAVVGAKALPSTGVAVGLYAGLGATCLVAGSLARMWSRRMSRIKAA
jgi:hypothetical protein